MMTVGGCDSEKPYSSLTNTCSNAATSVVPRRSSIVFADPGMVALNSLSPPDVLISALLITPLSPNKRKYVRADLAALLMVDRKFKTWLSVCERHLRSVTKGATDQTTSVLQRRSA